MDLVTCHYCEVPAPHDGEEAVYLVRDEALDRLEPSCPGHATHGRDGKLIDWRMDTPSKPRKRSRLTIVHNSRTI